MGKNLVIGVLVVVVMVLGVAVVVSMQEPSIQYVDPDVQAQSDSNAPIDDFDAAGQQIADDLGAAIDAAEAVENIADLFQDGASGDSEGGTSDKDSGQSRFVSADSADAKPTLEEK